MEQAPSGRADERSGPAEPLVTVLIAAWNAAATLERALDSVLAERSVDLECVVVDDASTDATLAVARRVARRDARVRVIANERNGGVSEARNLGLGEVHGTWLTFLDADDRLLPGAISALVDPTRTGDALAVIGQRVWTDGSRSWVSRYYDIPDIRVPGRKSLVTAPGLVYYASGTGKLFHRSCWTDLRFFGRSLGDQPWTIVALLRAGDRIEVIADDVYEWARPAPGSATSSITSRTRSSAQQGVEVAGIAALALEAVRAEAARLLEPGAAALVSGRYVERLLRSDLGIHLSGALRRRDPALPELLAAIERFIERVSPDLLAASDALAREIVEPPLRYWWRLGPESRAAHVALVRAARRADPGLALRARRSSRPAIRRLGQRGPRASAALALVVGAAAAGRIARRLAPPR